MVWRRVQPTAAELEGVNAERESHPQARVRRTMRVLWLLHCGLARTKAATAARLGRATGRRHVAAYRDGGPGEPRRRDVTDPVSDLASFTDAIRDSLSAASVRTAAEACDRIGRLTAPRREPNSGPAFLKALGFRRRRIRASPIPPQKTWLTTPGGDGRPGTRVLRGRRPFRVRYVPVPPVVDRGRSSGRSSGRRRFDVPGPGTPSPGNWRPSPTRRWRTAKRCAICRGRSRPED